MFTKYGIKELAVATLAALVLAGVPLAAGAFGAVPLWLGVPVALVPLAVWGWVLWFFRDPDRSTPSERGVFVAPADGCVTDITPLGSDSLLGRSGVQVGIFMSVFDVHVNRSPADVVVQRVEHRPGTFLDVRRADAWEQNESATIYLRYRLGGKEYPLVIRQVAGLVARRIVTDIIPGQTLFRGERIGMIKFGSRMELMVPRELATHVKVEVGQHVKAGLTVLVKSAEKIDETVTAD